MNFLYYSFYVKGYSKGAQYIFVDAVLIDIGQKSYALMGILTLLFNLI